MMKLSLIPDTCTKSLQFFNINVEFALWDSEGKLKLPLKNSQKVVELVLSFQNARVADINSYGDGVRTAKDPFLKHQKL